MDTDSIRAGVERAFDSMIEGLQSIRDRASRALTRFSPRLRGGEVESAEDRIARMSPRWGVLAAEVIERDDALVVRIEVPGMEPTELDVQVRDDHLIVTGEKRVQRDDTRGRYHVLECAYGHFARLVALPVTVDDARAEAKYRNGVLRVTLPKREQVGVRQIKIDQP